MGPCCPVLHRGRRIIWMRVHRCVYKVPTFCLWHMGIHGKTSHNRLNSPSVHSCRQWIFWFPRLLTSLFLFSVLCHRCGDARRQGSAPPMSVPPQGALLNDWCSRRWSAFAFSLVHPHAQNCTFVRKIVSLLAHLLAIRLVQAYLAFKGLRDNTHGFIPCYAQNTSVIN